MSPSIYDYVQSEEAKFETEEVQIGENWHWNFRKHVQLIFHLMHGVFFTGENNWLRSFKQVMRPLIRLSVWTEDLEVKDVVFYIESKAGRALSFLLKKYHEEVYTKEHDLDTFFDELTESDITYGGALVQKGVKRPEVVPLQSVAFCDQTDLLGGPVGFKHYFSPDKLRGMAKYGWGEEKNGATITLDDLCLLATAEKDATGSLNEKQNDVTGKTIEVYVVRGNLPAHYLHDDNDMEYHCNQLQIVALYTDKDKKKQGVTLYRKKEEEGSLKVHVSEKVYNRALGYGDGEALTHQQIWSNFANIHKMNLLEAAGKVPLYTDDPTYTQKNKIQDMENLEITVIEDNKQIRQVPTASPANFQLFERGINELYESAQLNVSAFDPLMGKEESAGSTFRGQERLVAQGRGWHDRRRGQRAKFIEAVYRDWIIPDMVREITKGKEFLADLTSEELMWVVDQLATNEVNQRIKDKMIEEGEMISAEEQDLLIQESKSGFLKKGNRHLLKVLKDEFDGIEVKTGINIAGKQKNLANLSDKLLSIIQGAMANPQGFMQAMQIPALARAFENVLEYSNVPIPDFYSLLQPQGQIGANQGQAEAQPAELPLTPETV
jgi:hypothetical protein